MRNINPALVHCLAWPFSKFIKFSKINSLKTRKTSQFSFIYNLNMENLVFFSDKKRLNILAGEGLIFWLEKD